MHGICLHSKIVFFGGGGKSLLYAKENPLKLIHVESRQSRDTGINVTSTHYTNFVVLPPHQETILADFWLHATSPGEVTMISFFFFFFANES